MKYLMCLQGDFGAASLRDSQAEAQPHIVRLKLGSLSESSKDTNLVIVIKHFLQLEKSCSPVCNNRSIFDVSACLVSPIVNGKQSFLNLMFRVNVSSCLQELVRVVFL